MLRRLCKFLVVSSMVGLFVISLKVQPISSNKIGLSRSHAGEQGRREARRTVGVNRCINSGASRGATGGDGAYYTPRQVRYTGLRARVKVIIQIYIYIL
jgi:hypothetical protein